MRYCPINEYRLTQKGKEVFKDLSGWVRFASVKRIELEADKFDLLLMSITPSIRKEYQDEIPFNGKVLVRI